LAEPEALLDTTRQPERKCTWALRRTLSEWRSPRILRDVLGSYFMSWLPWGAGMSQEATWYVARGSEQAGPFTGEQLRAMAASGDLKPNDQVWRPGYQSWQKAGDISGLLRPPALLGGDAHPPSPPPLPTPDSGGAQEPPARIAEPQTDSGLVGVRGWLLALCIQLTIVGPLVAIGQLILLFQRLQPSFYIVGLQNFYGFVFLVTCVFQLVAIVAGAMLWSRQHGAPKFTRWLLVAGFVWLCLSPYTIYLFVGMPPGAVPGILVAALPEIITGAVVAFGWNAYLLKSKRVQATFGLNSSATADFVGIPKIASALLSVTILCVLLLAFTTRQFDPTPAEELAGDYPSAIKTGNAIGAGIVILFISVIGAIIGRLSTRKSHSDRRRTGPIVGGVVAALLWTGLVWVGANSERLAGAPSTQTK
jgi:GYF domain 2/Protein of unknown function (DUF2569)